MWNSKTLKIDREFYHFKSPLPHINGVKCIWCVKKNCSLLYKKHKNVTKIKILWFEIIVIFKDETFNL
jgi:hypothetical protein